MTVKVTKPALNLREKLSELDKPSGIAGQDILKADTPQEVFNYIGAGRRNLIINGAMQVAQRGTSTTGINTSGYYGSDRLRFVESSLGTWTLEQSTDAPDGFSNSCKVTATTAKSSPASSNYLLFNYKIEGQDLQALQYGTSGAKTATLSFWVKSNKTGNATLTLRQPDASSRTLSQQYTINSSDTWEYKTLTIVGDTSGNIDSDNDTGIEIEWWLNSGSNFFTGSHSSTWVASDNTIRNASNLGVGGATSDYFAITGVQLEVGSVATSFEHRSYGEELALCQRYYYEHNGTNGKGKYVGGVVMRDSQNAYGFGIHHPVPMRDTPSLTQNNVAFYAGDNTSSATLTPVLNSMGWAPNGSASSSLGTSDGSAAMVYLNNGGYLLFNAEL